MGDLPYEVADLVEHVTVALPGLLAEDELGPHLDRLGLLTGPSADRLRKRRALLATFWLVMVLSGNRNRHLEAPRASSRLSGSVISAGKAEGPGR